MSDESRPSDVDDEFAIGRWIKAAFQKIESTYNRRQDDAPALPDGRLWPEGVPGAYLAMSPSAYGMVADIQTRGGAIAWLSGSVSPVELAIDLLAYRSKLPIQRLCSGLLAELDWPRLAHTAPGLAEMPMCIVPGATEAHQSEELIARIAAVYARSTQRVRVLVLQRETGSDDHMASTQHRAAIELAARLSASLILANGSCCRCERSMECAEHGRVLPIEMAASV